MIDTKQGEAMYHALDHKLKDKDGLMIAIDVETGDYFLGRNTLEACDKGRKKYPHHTFYIKRIGANTAFVVGAV